MTEKKIKIMHMIIIIYQLLIPILFKKERTRQNKRIPIVNY